MPKKHEHHAARVIEICACGATREDHGEWIERGQGNRAARALAMISTPAERQERAAKAGEARWAGSTEKERRETMTRIAKAPRPSRRIAERCPCGKYSRALAEKRGHKCG